MELLARDFFAPPIAAKMRRKKPTTLRSPGKAGTKTHLNVIGEWYSLFLADSQPARNPSSNFTVRPSSGRTWDP
jgi:hypothetical protein